MMWDLVRQNQFRYLYIVKESEISVHRETLKKIMNLIYKSIG